MSTQSRDHQKSSLNSAVPLKALQLNSRPFSNSEVSAFSPVTNQFQSRPFAVQAKPTSSSRQQELPNTQTQLKQAKDFNYDLSNISVFTSNTSSSPAAPIVQPKLTIGEPGDKYEQEADTVAAQVLRMPEPVRQQPVQREMVPQEQEEKDVQTKPLAASITPLVQRVCSQEEPAEQVQTKSLLQRATASGSSEASGDLESQLNSSKGGGTPLPDDVRSFMEPRFGTDFSGVRVHTDSTSVQMNKELGAQAFTHGNDIFYGAGKAPAKDELTAHEMTHTLQQIGKG